MSDTQFVVMVVVSAFLILLWGCYLLTSGSEDSTVITRDDTIGIDQIREWRMAELRKQQGLDPKPRYTALTEKIQ